MSWSVRKKGFHDEVVTEVDKPEAQVPVFVKRAVKLALSAFGAETDVDAIVSGHIDKASETGNLTIQMTATRAVTVAAEDVAADSDVSER